MADIKILISQQAPSNAAAYTALEEKFGVKIEFKPFYLIEPLTSREFRAQRVNIPDYTAVTFSSRHAIDAFFKLCEELRIKVPETMKYFCTTEAVAFYLQKYIQYRKRKIFAAKDSHPASFHEILLKNKELNMLIPCGQDGTSQNLLDFLDEHSIRHDQAVVFSTSPANLAKEVDIAKYDMIVMFSPNGVKSLKANFPDFQQGEVAFAALGTAVINELEAAGWTAQVVAPTPNHPSITDALDAFLKDNATRRR